MHVVGPTGVGKTALLANMMRQDMASHGIVLMENKGDLFHTALDYVPHDRMKDVVVLNVNDTQYPVGFNLADHDPVQYAYGGGRIVDAFERLDEFSDSFRSNARSDQLED